MNQIPEKVPVMPGPSVTVIVPTCGRLELLRQCLQSVLKAADSCPVAEILVSDDSPGHETKRMIAESFPGVTWSQGPRKGAGANRNAGVRRVGTEWVVFVDDDCIPGPGWLSAYTEMIDSCGAHQVLEGSTASDPDFDPRRHEAPVNLNGGILPACNFAIRRDLFLRIGGFRECFSHWMEDVDLCRRLTEIKIPIVFVPAAAVLHPMRLKPGTVSLALRWRARLLFEILWGKGSGTAAIWLPLHVLRVRMGGARRIRGPISVWMHGLVEAFLVATFAPIWVIADRKSVVTERRLGTS